MSEAKASPYRLHTADIFEGIADAVPDAPAIVWGAERRSWREFEDRAARLAAAFRAAGLGPGSSVVLYLHNSPAYLEAHFAALKMRAAPVNGNYRYLADELLYLLENSDAEAIVFDEVLAPRVAALHGRLDRLKLLVEVGASGAAPGSAPLEALIAAHAPLARMPRDPDDEYLIYTGGTTGLPKGVKRRVGPSIYGLAAMSTRGPDDRPPMTSAEAVAKAVARHAAGAAPVSVVGPPFMHGTGMSFGAQMPLIAGGCVVIPAGRSFDADEMLRLIHDYRATRVTIAGDVMARPMLQRLEAATAAGRPYDLSSVETFYSSGMIWTAETKRALLAHAPQAELMDLVGSSEGGIGTSRATLGHVPDTGVFTPNPGTTVLREDGTPVAPGSGERGLIAVAGGTTGVGYHKDPEKTAKTYQVINGVTYAIAGDWATIEADGSIRFLGRESACINTGGEKVFAEEVEKAVLTLAGVTDCLVVGLPDPRWGQIVCAVVALSPGAAVDAAQVQEAVRGQLAGYKVPRRVAIVERTPRAANGKADYAEARRMLEHAAAPARIGQQVD